MIFLCEKRQVGKYNDCEEMVFFEVVETAVRLLDSSFKNVRIRSTPSRY